MAQQTKTTLKTYFNTGDQPTEAQFSDLIDSQGVPPESGAGAPSSTPNYVGKIYHDTTAGRIYVATGIANSGDWKLIGTNVSNALTVSGTGTGIAVGDVLTGTTSALTLADSDTETTAQVLGIASAVSGTDVDYVAFGVISGIDTNLFSDGDILYVSSTAGGLTTTPPATGFVSEVGTVLLADPFGSILVNPKVYGSATVEQEIFIPAQAFTAATTNGPAAEAVDLSTQTVSVLSFDAATDETAFATFKMPNGWDEGTLTYKAYWSHPTGTGDVIWSLAAGSMSNDEAFAALGTPVGVTDSGGTADDLYISPISANVTVGGTPAEGDMIVLSIARDADNGADTLTVDARLHGVAVYYTRNAIDDGAV